MRARGRKPGGAAWAVAVEKPRFGVREVGGVVELDDRAIATSGDYRRWIDIAGTRYAHTMNPTLGQPASNRLAAVTVFGATCMLADAWRPRCWCSERTRARHWRAGAAWMRCSCCARVARRASCWILGGKPSDAA
ncbi:MAG: FAD:protein FMN transferase [Massilia sp.]